MIGMICMAGSCPSASPRFSFFLPAFSFSICFWKRRRAASSRPNVCIIFFKIGYGGRSPCSSSSRCGTISASMNRRIMSRIITWLSFHSIIGRLRARDHGRVATEMPAQ
jgi:hypothetical protein